MCGGDIEVNQDMSLGTCLYCGSKVTIPKIDDEKKVRLFNRANEYRMNCDFDKAYGLYEAIVEDDTQEAEAYWGLILSEYGVEYVEDPKSGKRIPTCHRINVNPIKNSSNYKKVIKYADAASRIIYDDEATVLDELQQKALSVSLKEKPYDVFICYKESNAYGHRTEDSVLAQNIYEELEKRNIRTFFARISLEDKIGQDYEPYIYSALKSAKVMLVVATCREHCESVWVKNEWSRYLRFMKEEEKSIIPVYVKMSANEFPDELPKFQAQDMGKIGAMQDLVRGIQKLLGYTKGEKRNTIVTETKQEQKIENKETEVKEVEQKKNTKLTKLVVVGIVLLLACFIGYNNKASKNIEISSELDGEVLSEINSAIDGEILSEEQREEKYNEIVQSASGNNYSPEEFVTAVEFLKNNLDYKESRQLLIDMICYRFVNRKYDKEFLDMLIIVGEIAEDKDALVKKLNKASGLRKIYYQSIAAFEKERYFEADKEFEALAKVGYQDSQDYWEKIQDVREKSKDYIDDIKGIYKTNQSDSRYLVFMDDYQICYTAMYEKVEEGVITEECGYEYLPNKGGYYIWWKSNEALEVVLTPTGCVIKDLDGKTEGSALLGEYTKME